MKPRLLIVIISALLLVSIFGVYTFSKSDDPDDITVAYLPSDHHAAFLVAKSQNIYQNEGLKVKSVQISTGSNIVEAVASGEIDIAYVGITPALQGIANGVPIKIVGAVNMEGSGIVVDPDSNITNTTDLKGRSVATPGVSSIQQVLILYQLQKYNLNSEDDVDLLSVNIFMIPSTLAAHKVDAYIAYEPFVSLAQYRNIGDVMMYSNEIMPDHPCCVIIAREDFINQHPQELQKFLDIHRNSTDYVNSHKNETAQLISKEITTNPELEVIALSHVVFVSQVDQGFQEKVLDFMKIEQELGYFKKNLTAEQIFDTRFLGGN